MHTAGIHNIQLNTLKHHLGAIRRFIATCPVTGLSRGLQVLGNSRMDLYLGRLEEEDIYRQVLQALQSLDIHTRPQYAAWLEQHHRYRAITLSDQSVWILRLGQEAGRYIHLHPGRYSPATVRVKAAVLKSAIALQVYLRHGLLHRIDEEALNRVRREVLGLPPVKALAESRAIMRLLALAVSFLAIGFAAFGQ